MPAPLVLNKPDDYWSKLDLPEDSYALHQYIITGFSFSVLKVLSEVSEVSISILARASCIKPTTLRRRELSGWLNRSESDAIYRFAAIHKSTLDLFEGDLVAANAWVTTSLSALDGECPIDFISSTKGQEMVIDLLGQLEHSVTV